MSAFREGQAFHFATQLADEDLAVVDCYNRNNNGFGALYRLPVRPPAGGPRFHSAFLDENPPIAQTVGGGFSYPFRMPFTPRGLYNLTPFTHGNDEAAPAASASASSRTRARARTAICSWCGRRAPRTTSTARPRRRATTPACT